MGKKKKKKRLLYGNKPPTLQKKTTKRIMRDRLKELMEIVQKKNEREVFKIVLHLGKLIKKRPELEGLLFPLEDVKRIMEERKKEVKVGLVRKLLKKEKALESNRIFLQELVTPRYVSNAKQICENFFKKHAETEKDQMAMAIAIAFLEAHARGIKNVPLEQNPFFTIVLEVSKSRAKKVKRNG